MMAHIPLLLLGLILAPTGVRTAPATNASLPATALSIAPHGTPMSPEAVASGNALVFFLTLLVLSEAARFDARHRRCDPLPFEWRPLQRAWELAYALTDRVYSIAHLMDRVVYKIVDFCCMSDDHAEHLCLMAVVHGPIDWLLQLHLQTVLFTVETPVDLVVELIWGEPVFIPRTPEGYCHVYCGWDNESPCEYV